MAEKLISEVTTEKNTSREVDFLRIKLDHIHHRTEDIHKFLWYVIFGAGLVFTGVSIVIGVFSALINSDIQNEKDRLLAIESSIQEKQEKTEKKLIKQIEDALGKTNIKPKIKIFDTSSENLLEGQVVKAYFAEREISEEQIKNMKSGVWPASENGTVLLFYFAFRIKNVGDVLTDRLYYKVYSKNPIKMLSIYESGEKNFDFESFIKPTSDVLRVPVGATYPEVITVRLPNDFEIPKSGNHPFLIKVFYGGEQPEVTNFFIEILDEEENPRL